MHLLLSKLTKNFFSIFLKDNATFFVEVESDPTESKDSCVLLFCSVLLKLDSCDLLRLSKNRLDLIFPWSKQLKKKQTKMEETCFVPGIVPQNKVVALDDDLLIYTNRCHIFLLKDGRLPQMIHHAHSKPVTDVVAAPVMASDSLKRSVATCGGDGYVRLWNVDLLQAVKAHQTHHTRSAEKIIPAVTALSWSTVNPNLIFSVAENGCIVQWHLAENLTVKFSLGNVNLSAVACSTTDESLIATVSGGQILLIRVISSDIKVTRLRAFQKEVCQMAWQPNSLKLCATSLKGELSIWDMAVPKCIKCEKVDFNPKYQEVILPILWADEKTLVCRRGSYLVTVDYETLFKNNVKLAFHTLHTSHRRVIFALAHASKGNLLWSFSLDRTFVSFDLEKKTVEHSIGNLFGGCFCGAVSPHDPNLVAFGSADGNVRVWNLTQPTGSCFTESRNIADRVMSICWHPVKDNILLYGTKVGRIGFLDRSKTNAPQLLQSPGASGKAVYWLCWGPKFMAADQTGLILYVVKKETIYTYDDLLPNTEPTDFGKKLSVSSVRDMCWKPDYSLLAVGSNSGSIHLFKPSSFVPVHTILGTDPMQSLAWHPEMTSTENEISPYHNLLSFGTLNPNGEISVYKVQEMDSIVSSSVFATLKGHKGYVQSVAWSPHVSGHLVSSSDDCSVQVWNVLTETPIANFQTRDMVWCSFWSPVQPDLIISGSKEGAIYVWRISEQMEKLPLGNPAKNKKGKRIAYACEEATEKITREIQPLMKNGVECPKMAEFVIQNFNHNILTNMWSKKSTGFRNCYLLLEKDEKDRSEFFRLTFFKNESPSQKLEQLEEHSRNPNQIDELTSIMLYQGKIKELIELKIEEGGLTDALVGLAPSVSPRLWQSACNAYARQLRVGQQFTKAANYLIAVRDVEKAVEVLCEGDQYLEALCLAQTQLSANDSVFDGIVRLYAKHLESKGDFGRAAECFIYLKDYEQVIAILGRSQDTEALHCVALAARIAEKQEIFEKFALIVSANDIVRGSSKIVEKFSETILSAKLIASVHEILKKTPEEDSVPLFQKIAEEIDVQDRNACYAQLLSIQPTVVRTKPSHDWPKTQQVCLAFCADGENDPRRLRHVLSFFEHANLQGSNELLKACRHFSPNLAVNGIFETDHSLGISLRAFLSLGLLHKAGENEENALELLPQLQHLQKDLLDEKAFIYHRSKAELSAIQRKFSNTVKATELDETTKQMLSKRNELISQISKIEVERGVIPSPAIGFLLLRNVYQTLSYENTTAKRYLEIITEKYFPLIN